VSAAVGRFRTLSRFAAKTPPPAAKTPYDNSFVIRRLTRVGCPFGRNDMACDGEHTPPQARADRFMRMGGLDVRL